MGQLILMVQIFCEERVAVNLRVRTGGDGNGPERAIIPQESKEDYILKRWTALKTAYRQNKNKEGRTNIITP